MGRLLLNIKLQLLQYLRKKKLLKKFLTNPGKTKIFLNSDNTM